MDEEKKRVIKKGLHVISNTEAQDEKASEEVARIKRLQEAREQYELDKIDERMISLMIEYPSMQKSRLAKVLGISRSGLYKRVQKPSVIRALADLQKNGIDLIKEVQTSAMRRMRRLISSGDEKIALEASKFVLMPMFNQAQVNINEVKEKVYRVQFGEGGQMFSDVQVVEGESKKLTPLELLEQAEKGIVEAKQVVEKASGDK